MEDLGISEPWFRLLWLLIGIVGATLAAWPTLFQRPRSRSLSSASLKPRGQQSSQQRTG